MRDDQERQPALEVEPAHERRRSRSAFSLVEVAGRLVGPDDRRVVDERAGDRDALALAARERVGNVVRAIGEPDELERLERSLARFRAARRGRRAAAARRSRPRSGRASGCRTGRRSPSAGRGSRCARGRTSPTAASPRSATSPPSMESSPDRQLRSVVLPQPLGPMIATISPRLEHEIDAAERVHPDCAGVVRLAERAGLDDRRAHLCTPFVRSVRASHPAVVRTSAGAREPPRESTHSHTARTWAVGATRRRADGGRDLLVRLPAPAGSRGGLARRPTSPSCAARAGACAGGSGRRPRRSRSEARAPD